MGLSDASIKKAAPAERPYKLADERGLFLLINTNGTKLFRMKYHFNGKEKYVVCCVTGFCD